MAYGLFYNNQIEEWIDISKNTNLIYLDAQNNSALACIQVSQAIINSIPEDWLKDAFTNYSLDCSNQLDDDEDGIINDVDLCPDTPTGEIVDVNGCSESQLDEDGDGILNDVDTCPNTPLGEIVNADGCRLLSSDNFTIQVIGETCPDMNNGELLISAKESLSYVATINSVGYSFTDTLTLDGLSPGNYDICIVVQDKTAKYSYTLSIEDGTIISGKSSINSNKATIEIIEGTAPFYVKVNGIFSFTTISNTFDLDIHHGDKLEVLTSKDCEGIYTQTFDLFESIIVYPNPTKDTFFISVPMYIKEVEVALYNNISQLISKRSYQVNNGKIQLSLQGENAAIYIATILLESPVSLKIIKQ